MDFNVAKIASARASSTKSLTISLRVAGPLDGGGRFAPERRFAPCYSILNYFDENLGFVFPHTSLKAARVFSGASFPAPRWATTKTLSAGRIVSSLSCMVACWRTFVHHNTTTSIAVATKPYIKLWKSALKTTHNVTACGKTFVNMLASF